jgi:hypothetical protein
VEKGGGEGEAALTLSCGVSAAFWQLAAGALKPTSFCVFGVPAGRDALKKATMTTT